MNKNVCLIWSYCTWFCFSITFSQLSNTRPPNNSWQCSHEAQTLGVESGALDKCGGASSRVQLCRSWACQNLKNNDRLAKKSLTLLRYQSISPKTKIPEIKSNSLKKVQKALTKYLFSDWILLMQVLKSTKYWKTKQWQQENPKTILNYTHKLTIVYSASLKRVKELPKQNQSSSYSRAAIWP